MGKLKTPLMLLDMKNAALVDGLCIYIGYADNGDTHVYGAEWLKLFVMLSLCANQLPNDKSVRLCVQPKTAQHLSILCIKHIPRVL